MSYGKRGIRVSKKLGDLRVVPWAGEDSEERLDRQTRHSRNSPPKLLRLTHPVGVTYGLSGESKINNYKRARKVRVRRIMQHVVFLAGLTQLPLRGRQLLPRRMSWRECQRQDRCLARSFVS